MNNTPRKQEAMNPMSLTMNPPPLNNIRGYPYFIPDMQTLQNYPQMGMFNNLQQMNGYPYQIETNKEDSPMNVPSTPENKIFSKKSKFKFFCS